MPRSIPKGLVRDHVLRALADLDSGIAHPFGEPCRYELVQDGKRYPPNAVVGVAFRHLLGRVLQPEDFSGGEAPGQANFVLRELGFVVVPKSAEPLDSLAEVEARANRDWTGLEVALLVADYFAMLRSELAGEPYSKAEHNRNLVPSLEGRSRTSIEYKHQNVSAALDDRGLPYIPGYKPAKNYQRSVLPKAIEVYLDNHPRFFESLADAAILNPLKEAKVEGRPIDDLFDDPPARIVVPPHERKPWLSRRSRSVDFARMDALNRRLGDLGEKFAVEVERRRLLELGRDDLAASVERVSQTCGDGLGFDVLSFDESDESEMFIEVKTTGLGKQFPFLVTDNEVRCSEDRGLGFFLYRVFDFSRTARLYVLRGSLTKSCRLEPALYRATIGG